MTSADSLGLSETQSGLWRRVIAFWLDAFVVTLLCLLAAAITGLVVPFDESYGFGAAAMWMIPAFFLWFCGPAVLPNTPGKYLLGIRVMDQRTGGKPRIRQCLTRSLTIGLWPIEAALVAFSASKRRLGDRWAGTLVALSHGNSGVNRLMQVAGATALLLVVTYLLFPLAMANLSSFGAVQQYVTQTSMRIPSSQAEIHLARHPRCYGGRDTRATLVVDGTAADQPVAVTFMLESSNGEWRVISHSVTLDPREAQCKGLTTMHSSSGT